LGVWLRRTLAVLELGRHGLLRAFVCVIRSKGVCWLCVDVRLEERALEYGYCSHAATR
jgi:hypothetical protein